VPAPRDEAADSLSLLQKQLILSQVQILELEDVRDELRADLAQRGQALTELQTIADRALAQTQQSQRDEAAAQQALHSLRAGNHQLQLRVESLQRDADATTRRLAEIQNQLSDAKSAATAQLARIETLEREQQKIKRSRSWRWTAPLRSLERWLHLS
jgi:hypothetical protein